MSRHFSRAAVALASALLVAGCAGAGGGGASGEVDQDALTTAQDAVTAGYEGTYTSPPQKPTEPPAGKSVWIISCGQVTIGCAVLADGAKEAAEAAGWDATLYDGKLGVDNAYSTGVRQAVAAGADAIVMGSIDCPLVKAPLEEAKAAGILVVGVLAYDCDEERFGGGEALFSGSVEPNEDQTTTADYAKAEGALKAQWAIAHADGKPVALSLVHSDSLFGQDIAAGFAGVMDDCDSCELVPLDFTFADIAAGEVPKKVSQALVRNPLINVVTTPYDSLMVLGVAQSLVRASNEDIAGIGGEGYPDNLGLIEDGGGQDAAVYQATDWFGWASIDTLSRLFNDEPIEPAGIGVMAIDADHMPELESDGSIVPSIDFRAAYLSAWGQ